MKKSFVIQEMCQKVDFECLNGYRSLTVKEKERGRQTDRQRHREREKNSGVVNVPLSSTKDSLL